MEKNEKKPTIKMVIKIMKLNIKLSVYNLTEYNDP